MVITMSVRDYVPREVLVVCPGVAKRLEKLFDMLRDRISIDAAEYIFSHFDWWKLIKEPDKIDELLYMIIDLFDNPALNRDVAHAIMMLGQDIVLLFQSSSCRTLEHALDSIITVLKNQF